MSNLLCAWLDPVGVAAVVSALGLVGSALGFFLNYRKDRQFREFDAYHRLIQIVVSPGPGEEKTYVDRQIAAIFELRHFKRYYGVTGKMLLELKEMEDWKKRDRVIQEIEETINYIDGMRYCVRCRVLRQVWGFVLVLFCIKRVSRIKPEASK